MPVVQVRRRVQSCARRLACRAPGNAAGATLLELLFVVSIAATVTGIAVPAMTTAIDDLRTAAAARYVAARIGSARLDAVRHARATALRFEVTQSDDEEGGGREGGEGEGVLLDDRERDYTFVTIADGNGNGVRTAEIRGGVDRLLGSPERLRDKFQGVRFALMPDTPEVDGSDGTGADGIRLGSGQILTMSADGSSSSGTLYIRGRRSQYAVRVLGVTGRVRVLQYQAGNGTWINR
jgi:type II secretory pathway pseudopilin PulG